MRLSILGYGKMGHLVEKTALDQGLEISAIIDNEKDWSDKMADFKSSDVAIDFSMPTTAVDNICRAFDNGVPIVVGTTGWLQNLKQVEELCKKSNGKLLYGSNFSVGVNIFFKINQLLSKLMEIHDNYHPSITEIHHIHKKDSPSGTAIHLANDIIDNVPHFNEWRLTPCQAGSDTIPVTALREGEVPGTHEITWKSDIDKIEIRHTAFSREGFAQGAVAAARWLAKQPSGIYKFEDVFETIQ